MGRADRCPGTEPGKWLSLVGVRCLEGHADTRAHAQTGVGRGLRTLREEHRGRRLRKPVNLGTHAGHLRHTRQRPFQKEVQLALIGVKQARSRGCHGTWYAARDPAGRRVE